ncbi:ThuA domain-containing protein [Spirosoma montaniterrae]|uniref:Crp/Fnr family transcriptional regulator n=1 Tax=Spirosoma montaniterrae TaxID=1178516 RepID=A0A1P9WZ12_9BACT|nr:ThuA domain-containing protein [Spirosoma montaniterrae]AQG80609.1 Crp/Fnr family transcriptional regulator [Spirosoma montaniterrae]
MKHIYAFLLIALYASAHAQDPNWKRVRVLVYTKNGKGYVHDNIPFAVQAVLKLGREHGFSVDTSSRAEVFSESNLKKYNTLIFTSTNNDVFDSDAQRLAFRRYIEAGGGFVGVHSVTGTERNWVWFKRMLGGTFLWHAKFQPFNVRVIDSNHSSMKGIPAVWTRNDECYFAKELSPGPTAVLAHDITSLDRSDPREEQKIKDAAGHYNTLYPAAWYYDFDGGHTWCTALGHSKEDYSEPTFVNHLFQGIRYVVTRVKQIDFSRAYATNRDEPIR